MPPKVSDFKRLLAFHANILSPSTDPTTLKNSHEKIAAWLSKFGFPPDALISALASAQEAVRKDDEARAAADAPPVSPSSPYDNADPLNEGEKFNLLDLLMAVIDQYLLVTPHQCLLIALWILHTHIFEKRLFMHTPRLMVSSPVRGCGKTTLMILLDELVANGDRSDNVSAASLYYDMDPFQPAPTFLLDEGDNLDLLSNKVLRAFMNAGNIKGGTIKRYVMGRPQRFEVFAPLAVAAIDALNIMPMPLLRRCTVVEMRRRPLDSKPLQEMNTQDPGFQTEREMLRNRFIRWAANFRPPKDPDIPQQLSDSSKNNWRVLLAIADDLGKGVQARAAALALSERSKEDETIELLADIRAAFDALSVDSLWLDELVEGLLNLPDSQWSDWRGTRGDLQPHKLTSRELRSVARSFGVAQPHTIWKEKKNNKGWYRSDFEEAWASYCSAGQPSNPPPKPKLPGVRGKRKKKR